MENKRGQGISVTAIILIVLGLIVLIVLILGFAMGWNNVKGWIAPSSNNVDSIAERCNIACTTEDKYNYCFMKRELKSEIETLTDTSCYVLNKKRSEYGVMDCDIDCGIYDSAGKELNEDYDKLFTANQEAGISTTFYYIEGTKLKDIECP